MSKVLTLDNLDVIKEYIDTQDQSVGDAYSQKIDEKFEEKITEINSNLEIAYNGVLKEMQESLETLDTKHTNYEEKTNVTLENLTDSFNKVDSILKIKPTGNTYYSEELKAIINDIKDIKDSYGDTSNTTGSISISDLAAMLNKTEVVGQLTNNTTFGSGIINLVSNHATIKPQNIDFGTITKASIKPTNNNWSWNNNGTGHIGTNGISVNSDGKLSFGGGVQLDFYSNVKGANSIVSNIENNVKTYITNDVVDKVVEKLGETNGIDKTVVYDVLKPYDYALGYDRNSSLDNYTEINNGVETERIRLNRLDSLEKATDINQRVNGNTTVDLKESISTMLETEYDITTKKVNGVDTDYSIMKSKRLDDIEDLLYINKTGKSGNSDVSYYNIITAIAGNPSGMPVSEKFDNVSEKGVLDMQFDAKDGLWEPKSNRLDKIEKHVNLEKWETEGLTVNGNIYDNAYDVLNDIQTNSLGGWNTTLDNINGLPTSTNAANTIKGALYNLQDRISDNKENIAKNQTELTNLKTSVFGDDKTTGLRGELTTLENSFETFKTKSETTHDEHNTRISELNTLISQLLTNASSTAISAAVDEFLKNNELTKSFAIKSEVESTYLKKEDAADIYVNLDYFTNVLNDYLTSDQVTNKITAALTDYITLATLNSKLSDYVKTTSLSNTLNSYVTTNNLNTQLSNYAKSSDLNSYVTTSNLSTILNSYAKASNVYTKNESDNRYVLLNDLNNKIGNTATITNILARLSALEAKLNN